jgi:hypothetical protein
MGTGYTRNDTANNIADGNVINASDLDGEFDAIQSAFNATTGHSHDGTAGEGPQIGTGGIADNAVTLGTKTTGNYVATAGVSGVGLSGSASAEGATFTVTSNATSANTASTIVARDASGNFSAGNVTVGNLITAGNVDGRDVSADGSKLDGIEAGATADQTAAEIRTLVESATDSNVFTDADHSKLNGIESGATADQTASEILTLIKTVDGAGSGLDADTLDGVSSASFLRSDAADTKTAGDLSFADNVKATFGTGSDLQIYHDGLNSYIKEAGTGDLIIGGSNYGTRIQDADSNDLFVANPSSVTLLFNGSPKLDTTATGVDITGGFTATSTSTISVASGYANLEMGGPSGAFIDMKSPASDDYDGRLIWDGNNLALTTSATSGGGVILQHQGNNTKLSTTATGVDVTGNATFADNGKAIFGAGSDLQIYHDGSNSIIKEIGTGDLIIGADNNIVLSDSALAEVKALFTTNGAVTLYYDNASKLATTATGVDVTGGLNTTGNVGIGTSSPLGKLKVAVGDNAPAASGNMNTGVVLESASVSRALNLGVDNTAGYSWINAAFSNNSSVPDNLVLMTGTNERMRIDSSGNVGIGTSPTKTLDVDGQLRIRNGGATGYGLLEYGASSTATNNWHVGSEGDGSFRFYNGNFGSGTERMRIDSSGKVTITKTAVAGSQTASVTGSTTLDFGTYQNFILTLTGNITLANPTTEQVGQSGFITFIQTGGYTVSLGTDYETAGGAGITLSASGTDVVPYIVAASGRILLGAPQLAFA